MKQLTAFARQRDLLGASLVVTLCGVFAGCSGDDQTPAPFPAGAGGRIAAAGTSGRGHAGTRASSGGSALGAGEAGLGGEGEGGAEGGEAGMSGGMGVGGSAIGVGGGSSGGIGGIAGTAGSVGAGGSGVAGSGVAGSGMAGSAGVAGSTGGITCAIDNGGCDSLAACSDGPGGPSCSACPPGYDGTGASGCTPHRCIGAPDASCACLRVAPEGSDSLAPLSGGLEPFATVQAAIDFADQHREHATRVCVAEGTTCGSSAAYAGPSNANLRMRSGISVYGNYESSGWTRCSSGTTTLLPTTEAGVMFDSSIVAPTVLDGFVVGRLVASTTTGITVAGAQGVDIDNVTITGGESASTAYGIDVSGGADARLSVNIPELQYPWSSLPASSGQVFGIRALGSHVSVIDSSIASISFGGGSATGIWLEDSPGSSVIGSAIDGEAYIDNAAGKLVGIAALRCGDGVVLENDRISSGKPGFSDSGASESDVGVDLAGTGSVSLAGTSISIGAVSPQAIGLRSTGPTITASPSVELGGGGGGHFGMWLEDAPGSQITSSIRVHVSNLLAQGLQIVGDATGTLLSSPEIRVEGPSPRGVQFAACTGQPPRVSATVSTTIYAGTQGSEVVGIRAASDCPVDIESAGVIVTAEHLNYTQTLTGIDCKSSCVIAGSSVTLTGPAPSNETVLPPLQVVTHSGIICPDCGAIKGNHVSGLARTAPNANTTVLRGTGIDAGTTPLVSGNVISAGCSGQGAGLIASGRIENNIILGASCGAGKYDVVSRSIGLQLSGDAVVHSNTVSAGGPCDYQNLPDQTVWLGCASTAIAGNAASIRNNIVIGGNRRGAGVTSYVIQGDSPVLQNNDLLGAILFQSTGAPAGDPLTTIAEVNSWPNGSFSGNFSSDPLVTSDYHLTAGSPCIDTGTKSGAPATDVDGEPRDSLPDVGADEATDCIHDNGGCDPKTTCTGTAPGVQCGPCPSGYGGDGTTGCVDIDECALGLDDCVAPRLCKNQAGSFSCDCPPHSVSVEQGCICQAGFTDTGGGVCVDIDECATNHGGCDPLTVCTNTEGGRTCGACPAGYAGSGDAGCTPIVYCQSNPCKSRGLCFDMPGDYVCSCPQGFTGKNCELGLSQIAVGQSHACGLRPNGALQCWGGNAYGQASPPSGSFTAVAAGENNTCALQSDGTLVCFGDDTLGQSSPPVGTFTGLSVSSAHACALRSDQTVACWGYDYLGESTPPSGSFKSVAAGGSFACGVHVNGALECWGASDQGGATPPAGSFKSVAAGDSHGCAIAVDDTITCWGSNSDGQIEAPSGAFVRIIAGGNSSCAVRADQTVACWGLNASRAPATGAFVDVDLSYASGCGVGNDGSVACWGSLGLIYPPGGAFQDTGICRLNLSGAVQCDFVEAPSEPFAAVAQGSGSPCALRPDHTIACWGFNPDGRASPPQGTFTEVAVGQANACGVRTDGSLACWGPSAWGITSPPAGVFVHVAVGATFGCAIARDATLHCWGGYTSGFHYPPPAGTFTALSSGYQHSCALATNGTLACWGYDSAGQATPPGGTFEKVSCGNDQSCGIRNDGTIACWGDDSFQQSSPPSGTFTALAAGIEQTCAVRSDSSDVCWGAYVR